MWSDAIPSSSLATTGPAGERRDKLSTPPWSIAAAQGWSFFVALACPDGAELAQAAASFARRASRPEEVHPRILCRATPTLQQAIAEYLFLVEFLAQALMSQRAELCATIPKAQVLVAQRRPIIIFGRLARLWGKLRRRAVRQWWTAARRR